MARRNIRREMAAGAARLLATKGLEGTSFAEVLDAVGAPRGSVYHHFPGGKQELIDAALDLAHAHATTALLDVSGQPATEVLRRFTELWEEPLQSSDQSVGCAVMAVAVAAGDNVELLGHAGEIFHEWSEQLAHLFKAGGINELEAYQLAPLVLSACEGAVAIARTTGNPMSFSTVAAQLEKIVAAAEQRDAAERKPPLETPEELEGLGLDPELDGGEEFDG